MNKRELFKKSIAWSLIATMINPALMAPAFARDSDIYLASTSGTSTAEPNVLFILGTNDRMNVAEAWREYDPVTYDSHAEYLWNDLNIIRPFEVLAENAFAISDAAPPVNPFSPWGTWSGALNTDRKALWQATLAYALGTQGTDPGARITYRNYNDLSWYHWLPAGAATTDARLWSVSFNRFRGYQQVQGGVARGGVTFTGTTNFQALNQCASSLTTLQPSTIFMPSNAATNTGVYLNQQWARFEPYLSLGTTNNGGYPGVQTNTSGYARGYLDSSVNPPNTAYRDQANSSGFTGARGQPIRTQQASSNANWADVAADGGGYVYQSLVLNAPTAVLTNLRTTAYGSTYSLLASTGASSAQIEQFSAWKGSRDGGPAFGMKTGTAGYYDVTQPAYPAASPTCDPNNGLTPPGTGGTSATCINVAAGGGNATKTRPCNYVGSGLVPATENDASIISRTRPTGSCTSGVISCNNTNPAALPVAPGSYCDAANPAYALPANPGACGAVARQDTFIQQRSTCAWAGRQSVPVNTCIWSGRTSVYIEGQGTYFYGGTCTESGVATNCSKGGGTWVASRVLNGVAQSDVTGPYGSPPPANGTTTLSCNNTLSAGTYYNGGVCQGTRRVKNAGIGSADTILGPAPAPTYCNIAGVTASQTIRGTAYSNVVFNNSVNGCNPNADTVGTCTGRYGAQCDNNVPFCSPVTSTASVGAGNRFYQVYNQVTPTTTNFVHDCKADEPGGSPGTFMFNESTRRAIATPWNATVSNGVSTPTASYTDGGGNGVPADPTKNIDVYSVNYLNFLYGAKACRDSAGALITTSPLSTPPAGATCSPIARKTRLQVAKDALSGLVITTDGVRLGLMVYNKTDTATADEGGNVVYAIRRMGGNSSDLPAYNNRASLVTAIQGVVASSRTPLTETLYEAYRYFSGRTPVFGTLATTAAVGGVVSAARETSVGVNTDPPSVSGNVYVTNGGGTYNSPMMNNPNVAGPANCQKNYIVMITNGQPEEDSSANAAIKTMAYAAGTGATVAPRTDFDTAGATPNNAGAPDYRQIPTVAGGNPYGPTDAAGTAVDGGYVWLDELTYYMSKADVSPGAANFQSEYTTCGNPTAPGHVCTTPSTSDLITGRQSIITYTIGFAGISAPVVQNAAVVSGGIYYIAQNAQQLQAALVAAFIAIKNWNPTAAAATVPISSLNRGESSHDVYLAFFGPSVASAWPGTVKKFEISTLASDCGTGIPLCLIGQTMINGLYNIQTVDPVTGASVVDPTASSGPNDLLHPPGSAWQASTVQDGALPTKGGTGHVLVNTAGFTPDQRKIYTYLTDSVTLYTNGTKSTTTNLTAVTNAVDYITNGGNIIRCRLGDSGACNGAAAMSFPTKETLISYVRGGNLGDSNCTDGSTGTLCSTWSTWPHFSVEHSKPVIVNYDSSTSPPVQYMYYVQNNGMLTAVDTSTGKEKWSFLIEEALPKLASLQANVNGPEIYVADGSPAVFYDDQNGDGIINGADRVWLYFGLRRGGRVYYALDITQKDTPFFKWKITAEQPSLTGDMTSGQNKIQVGWSASFAVGMQVTVAGAGASGADLTATITAINGAQTQITLGATASTTVAGARVTTIGTPLPAKVCNATSTCGAVAAYNELGQTWSTPNIVKLKALIGAANSPPALIFGGGYDPAEDTVPPGTRTMGRALFIVNGDNASTNDTLLKSFGAGQGNVAGDFRTGNMLATYAVPSDVTAINTDFDSQNYVDRLYVGDLGGNVWRIDVDDALKGNWKGELLASLSNGAGEKRKFFFPPAVAPQDHPFTFHAVYIGSGDKEHPLLTGSTTPATTDDRMFMLMDDPSLNSGGGTPDTGGRSALPTPTTLATLVDIADVSTTGADATSLISTSNSLKGRQGWSRRLQNGEKVINATTVFRLQAQISRLRFGTYAPLVQLNACTPPGEGRLNEIDSLTGDLLAINGAAAGAQRWYTGFLSRGYMSSTQLLILPSGGVGSSKIIYQFNCADANCQGTQIGQLGAPTKIYWYLEPEQ